MKITHTVLKNEDVAALPHRFQLMLQRVQNAVLGVRKDQGKSTDPKYFVVNADEPWAHEVEAVIAKHTKGEQ
ncbi:hypothetical protein D3C79_803250 [compost metagenome]